MDFWGILKPYININTITVIINIIIACIVYLFKEDIKHLYARDLAELKNEHRIVLEKYKSEIEIKKSVLVDMSLKRIESYRSTFDQLYRLRLIALGAEKAFYHDQEQNSLDEEAKKMTKTISYSAFYYTQNMKEQLKSFTDLIENARQKQKENNEIDDQLRKKIDDQLATIQKLMHNDLEYDPEK